MNDNVMLVVKQSARLLLRAKGQASMTRDELAMRDHDPLNRSVIVPLPAEIDVTNAEDVGERLRAAFAPGVAVVIADLGSTVFCDSSGVRQLLRAHERAMAGNCELRVVISSATVLRVLAILGVDRVLQIYPDLAAGLGTDGQG